MTTKAKGKLKCVAEISRTTHAVQISFIKYVIGQLNARG